MIQRVTRNGKNYIIGYHTQENRSTELYRPIKCSKDAWLGDGYYFWLEENFAHYWGEDCKIERTGSYDIYQAYIDIDYCINASFNEEGYFYYKNCIEEAIDYLKSKGKYIDLEQVNRFLMDHFWIQDGISGIIYDDTPTNSSKQDNNRHSVIRINNKRQDYFYYRKRIQIVVFNLKNICDFELLGSF